jgi:flagellar FliL protein
MAIEDEEKQEEKESEEAAPKKNNLILIIIIAAAVLLGGGAAVYFLFIRGGEPEKTTEPAEEGADEGAGEAEEAVDAKPAEPAPSQIKEGIIFPLEHFIVNVNDESGDIRYLKIEIKLELGNSTMEQEVENRIPKIRDSIVTILTNKSVADVSDTNGKLRLKEEIKARINTFLTLGKVEEVYFTDFIIQ